MDTILRAWTCWIRTEKRAACHGQLDAAALKRLRKVRGYQRAAVLFRDLGDGTTEVVVISVWESMEAIRAYAGELLTVPAIDLELIPKLYDHVFDHEPHVRHYALSDPNVAAMLPAGWAGAGFVE
jgi:hypothetical protein